ncbi:PREDICTED: putative uncharacterized protein DDB_G0282133 [Papilio xuthus]|uniref:Uncharacterized protein n=1 Tax=Papilio xuthus TaxID=66420 RepID=A0AAJ7E4R8_PAPXU|nr:PREDICTED: putative uncharacterized protein DDB_G0282133 [Papilio xuthus]
MRTFFIFSLIFYLFEVSSAKPLSLIAGQTRETGEAEYEGNEETAAEDYQQDSDQDSSVDTQEGTNSNGRREAVQDNSRLPDLNNNPYKQHSNNLQRGHLNNFDNFPEISGISRDARNDKISNTNIDSNGKPGGRYRQPDTYSENNEQDARQHFNDNAYKINHAQNLGFDNNINKRAMLPPGASDEGDLLFENNRDQLNKLDKSGYAREGEPGLQPRFFKHQAYNMPGENKEAPDFKRYDKWRLNRNRRQTPKTNLKTNDEANESTPSADSKEIDLVNEDEESAIKRHVKKLSGPELEELFNTLSDDKRSLLKKIIDNDADNDDTVSKREITKKAGAVEQNSYIENGQLDSSKIQGVSSNVEESNTETSLSHETTETSKKSVSATELGEIMPSKSSGGCDKSENKLDLANPNEDLKEVKSEGILDLESKKSDTDVDLESNSQIMTKNDNKREANINEMTNMEKSSDDTQIVDRDYSLKDFQGSMNNQDMFLQDDELTDLINEETERQTSHKNGLKREASPDESVDLSKSIKSLEESFPNPKSYDESNPFYGSDMAPLVRVKRKDADSAIMKRSASVIADSNVPYFPNKGENDDEDNDEGSEFDEDGFYDRTSNFARNNDNKPYDTSCAKEEDRIFNQKAGHIYGNENLESDTSNLGSDTDNAMTGAEGINDNLMYSALRDRRTSEENDNKVLDDKIKDMSPERRLRSTPLMDNQAKTVSETNINVPVPGYQENDAFGPLPRSYEGDLGRYKRIRRVKQMPMFQENLTQTE